MPPLDSSDMDTDSDEESKLLAQLDRMTLDELERLNITDVNQLDCLFNFLRWDSHLLDAAAGHYCNSTWDGILCWPTTPAGSTSILPCIGELNGISYDTSRESPSLPIYT